MREQNWFAVFLDFFIVVAGILIAFQITNWNEERGNAKKEVQLLGRLVDDLTGMRGSFITTMDVSTRAHDGWITIFRALESCEALPDQDNSIQFALSRYQSTDSPEIRRAAFDEMQATGAFTRLSNGDMLNDLTSLYSLLDSDIVMRPAERENQLAAGRIMWKSIAFTFPDNDADSAVDDASGSAVFDTLDHCDDLELRGAVWELVDINRDWLRASENYVVQIDRILTYLTAEERQ